MPTDHGWKLLEPPALPAEQASTMPVTGPPNLEDPHRDFIGSRWEWDST
jgi:hypothetical protein